MANKKALVDMLSRNRLFDGFAKKDIAAIINSATEVVHPEGKVIVIEERPGVGFHLLLEGTAFDEADRPVEFSRTYVPGDRSKFLIESTGRWVRGLRSMRGSEQGAVAIDGLVLASGSGAGNERGRETAALEEGSLT